MPLLMTSGAASMGAFGFGRGSGGTTWNPNDKSSEITLTNGNLTASDSPGGSTFTAVRSTTSKTAGAWQVEIRCEVFASGSVPSVGLANASAPLNAQLGLDTNSIVWQSGGTVVFNGVSLAVIDSYGPGDTVAIFPNFGLQIVVFQKNGGAQYGPYNIAAMSGPRFVIGQLGSVASPVQLTANFGRSPFLLPTPPTVLPWNR
jgi:hypothetical protein